MEESQAATTLLTEHLQYTPLALIDDIIDSVNNLVYQGVGSLESGLTATPPARLGFKASVSIPAGTPQEAEYPTASQEIEEGLHKLETLLNSTVDKNFDKFEIYVLRNILSVPPDLVKWIQLSHYEGMQHHVPTDAPTPETVQLLRQKLNASRNVNKALQRELRRNEALLDQIRQLTAAAVGDSQTPNLSFLTESTVAQRFPNRSQPLTTATSFTLSQLPALQSALTELRSKLVTLRGHSLSTDTAKDERREQRREYIEQRTKALLERSGQPAGDDLASSGRGRDPHELESLEKMASMFPPT